MYTISFKDHKYTRVHYRVFTYLNILFIINVPQSYKTVDIEKEDYTEWI